MQTTSTTQHQWFKNVLALMLIISAGFFQFSYAQNGCVSCKLGYPDNSNLPRSAQDFNESDVLRAFDPGPSICGKAPEYIKLWYSDEHALTLGVRRVIVKSAAGTTTTDYPITATPAAPTCVDHPLVGTTANTGDQTGNDVAVDGGRPLWPALFITDLTVNGMSSRKGDWQQGGSPIAPSRVCGTWKAAVRTVDKTRSPEVVTVTPDADPAKNVNGNTWDLGGGDQPPAGTDNEGYGAVVYWKLSELNLIPGHSYRLQFMVHDGDQNKSGGDVGDTCTTMVVPIPPSSIGDFVWNDTTQLGDAVQHPNSQGRPNMTVTLYDASGNVVATTFTDAKGKYLFDNVDVASGCKQFKVGFSGLPSDSSVQKGNKTITVRYSWVRKHIGGDSTLDSDPNQSNGITDLFTLCPGQNRLDIDAGVVRQELTIVPVTLTSFKGKYENSVSVLNWLMSSQDNISTFDVERSTDATNFSSIGSVKAVANVTSYTFNDKNPLAGVNYYRLKMNSGGGSIYGNTVAINVTISGISIKSVGPNPFRDQLKVSVASDNTEPVSIRLVDNAGRVLKVVNVTAQKGNNDFLVNDLGALNAGLYVVEVKTPFALVRSKVSK